MLSRLTVTSAGSRPTSAQCARRTSTLWATVAGSPVMLRHVGVARHQAQRAPLAATADEDRRPAGRTGRGTLRASWTRVVAAVEGRRLLGEHGPADLQRLVESVEPLPDRWEVEAQPLVLDVVPRRADAEDGPAPR